MFQTTNRLCHGPFGDRRASHFSPIFAAVARPVAPAAPGPAHGARLTSWTPPWLRCHHVVSCMFMLLHFYHRFEYIQLFWISLDAKSRTGHIFGKQKIGVQPMMDIWGTLQWPLQIWRYATLPCTRFETRRALKPQLSSASQRGTQRIDQNFLGSPEPSPSSFRW